MAEMVDMLVSEFERNLTNQIQGFFIKTLDKDGRVMGSDALLHSLKYLSFESFYVNFDEIDKEIAE